MTSNLLIARPGIPKDAMVTTSKGTYDEDMRLANGKRGLRHNYAKLGTAATSEWVQRDLGAANTGSADHLIIARADMLQSDGVDTVTLTGSSAATDEPLRVTTAPTWWIDFSDDATVTMDAQRRISAVTNKSGTVAGLTQTTDANKFVRTRRDNQENTLQYSEDVSNAVWSKSRGAITGTTQFVEASDTNQEHRMYQLITTIAGQSFRAYLEVKPNGRDLNLRFTNGYTGSADTYYTINSAPTAAPQAYSGMTATQTALAGGWFALTLQGTASTTNTGSRFDLYPCIGTTSTYSGNGSSGYYIRKAQFQSSLADTTYIATTDHPMFRGVNNRAVARADGSNDCMTSTATLADIFAASAKTLIIAMRPNAPTATQRVIVNATGTNFMMTSDGAGFYTYNDDGSASDIIRSTFTAGAIAVYSFTHDGVNLKAWKDATAATPVASGNSAALTGAISIGARVSGPDLGYNGELCEILAWNVELSSADRLAVVAYLTAKYSTAPSYASAAFSTATLYGTESNDFVTTFTVSTAYRYWWLEYKFADALTTSVMPRSKEYFGTLFDPGKNPSSYEYELITPTETNLGYSLGHRRILSGIDPYYRFTINWELVSDANAQTFQQMIDQPAQDLVFLYAPAAGNPEILAGKTLVHCKIISDECEVEAGTKADTCKVKAVFEECLG